MARYTGAAVLLLGIAACGKSVEGETRTWEKNGAKIRELQALYPGFEPALKERWRSAEELFNAARQIGDEKEKAKKMAAANELAMSGFVGKLDRVDAALKSVRNKSLDAAKKTGDGATPLAIKTAVEDSQRTLDRVQEMLKQGAKDVATAEALVPRILGELETAEANLGKVLSAPAKGNETTETPKTPEPWRCGSCGNVNNAAERECRTCGAAK